MAPPPWLSVTRGEAPLIVSVPHAGLDIPGDLVPRLVSPWRARKDADWWLDRLYGFAAGIGATVIATSISRTVIDVNRDPGGASLYPGQATTALCPTETFDGEPLYHPGQEPSDEEILARRDAYFAPYHRTIADETARLCGGSRHIVLYDCHSIRSMVPRLFAGLLPQFNIGTNGGASCSVELTTRIEERCDQTGWSRVTNGRFTGGYITRRHGQPEAGVHAVQMELACRGYLQEPIGDVSESDWPAPFREAPAQAMTDILRAVLEECIAFCQARPGAGSCEVP